MKRKQLTMEGLEFIETESGRWLIFHTDDGSTAALHIEREFPPENRVVHEVIQRWAKEQVVI
jgi:hypothetical protein